MRAFERLEGETQTAYQAFQKYLELGPERTLAKATDVIYGEPKTGPRREANGRVRMWAKTYDWHQRAQAWDDLLTMIRMEAVEDAERKKATDIAERNLKLNEDILALKERLIPKLMQMMDFPLAQVTKKSENGKEITIVKPARWSFNTLVNALGVLTQLPEAENDVLGIGVQDDMDRTIAQWEAEVAARHADSPPPEADLS